jgi:hypothetical protein
VARLDSQIKALFASGKLQMSLNEEQKDYMRYLATVPAAKKCWCAWYMADECPNCKGRGTLEDRLKVQCAGCDNYPSLYDRTKITHRIGCKTPDWQPPKFSCDDVGGSPK